MSVEQCKFADETNNSNMARKVKIFIAVITLLLCCPSLYGQIVRKIVPLTRVVYGSSLGDNKNEDPIRGDRIPEDGLFCVIDSSDGVYICGREDETEFDSYEIWDSPNTCMAVYYDEPSFVKAALTIQSTCKIRINTSSTCYEGILKK